MMIFKILKQIPNDLLVLDKDVEDDDRVIFILENYSKFIEDGYDLPEITDQTTFKELKENLQHVKATVLLDFLTEYKEKFIDKDKPLFSLNKFNLQKLMVIFILGLVFLIIIITLFSGILKGDLESTSIIQAFFEFISKVFGSIFGSPEPF